MGTPLISNFPQYSALSISWNPIGSVIGIAYGKHDHENWCTHKGMFCTWNLDRGKINPNKADLAVDVSVSITLIPSLLTMLHTVSPQYHDHPFRSLPTPPPPNTAAHFKVPITLFTVYITCKRLCCAHHSSLPTRKSKNQMSGRFSNTK